MGEHDIQQAAGEDLRVFTKKLLNDLRALEHMLATGVFETDVTRIGAEQEVFLVDPHWRAAPVNLEILQALDDRHYTTELGRFNLEFNLDPIRLGGDCLSRLETQLVDLLSRLETAAEARDARVVLTGILPTLDKSDLTLENMTPVPRYYALNEAMNRLRGQKYDFRLKGRDELLVQHDNVMLEACNTSFQVHFQVAPANFARRYNVAQAVTAPVLAAATNSPLLFGRHLWRETRIALFQQSVDTRAPTDHLRELSPRVSFGRDWVRESALEIFQEDIARYRVILGTDVDEDPFDELTAGKAPQLRALRLHNGTIYRWNRPCYGISDGKPHLRIENRVLPSGPTPTDEIANAAFWFGLMGAIEQHYGDVTEVMDFGCVHENFVKAARLGLSAQFTWPGHQDVPARTLILDELLPLAREGLANLGIDDDDADRFLDVICRRVETGRTGSQWLLDSLAANREGRSQAECLATLVAGTYLRGKSRQPVHEWTRAEATEAGSERMHYRRVEQIMVTDLFTVTEDELVDMAAYVMDWKHIRHVPVEDSRHRLVGLVTHRSLLRLLGENLAHARNHAIPVSEIMQRDVVTVSPDTLSLDAIKIMRRHRISCLPVVEGDGKLVGIVTERDFMGIAGQLLERFLGEEGQA